MKSVYLILLVAVAIFVFIMTAVIFLAQKKGQNVSQDETQQIQRGQERGAAGEPQIISREEYERQATSEPVPETTSPASLNQ